MITLHVIFALSNAEFDHGRGRGLETDKKCLRTAPKHERSRKYEIDITVRLSSIDRSDSICVKYKI